MKNIMVTVVIIVFLTEGSHFLEANQKSTFTALSLSIGIPIGGILLGSVSPEGLKTTVQLGSLYIGPSTGHFYAHQWWRGLGFMCARTGLGLWGMARGLRYMDQPDDLTIILMCGAAFVTIIDIALVPNSVHKYNSAHSIEIKPRMNLKERNIGLSVTCRI